MACLSLLRIRHALATCAAGLMLALPAMASSSNTTDLGLDREAALRTSQAAIGRKVGDHILLNREGVPTSLASYRGKPLLVSFIYTGCFQVCPTTTRSLQEAVEGLLKSVGPNQFNVVSIGFNQPADSPQALKSFATQYGIRQPNWEFLSPPAALVPDLARDFGFVFQASPAGFDHVLQVSILDGEGRIVRQVYGEGVVPSELGEPLKMLLAGQPVESNELIEHLVDRVRILCTVFDFKIGTYKVDYTLPIQIAGGVTFFVLMLIFFINEWRSSRKMARSKGMRNA